MATKTAESMDYGPIRDDYRFFEDHSTEAAADVAAYLPHIRRQLTDCDRPVRMLDFGCGDGRFSKRLHEAVGLAPADLVLAIMEPQRDYLVAAKERLQPLTDTPITAGQDLQALGDTDGFDLAVANHCLYFPADLTGTVAAIMARLRPGGLFLTAMSGQTNFLIQLWELGYGHLEKPVPHHIAEDLDATLLDLQLPFQEEWVHYDLRFPDLRANRLSICRFLFGADLAGIPPQVLLAAFEPHVTDGYVDIHIPLKHYAVKG